MCTYQESTHPIIPTTIKTIEIEIIELPKTILITLDNILPKKGITDIIIVADINNVNEQEPTNVEI